MNTERESVLGAGDVDGTAVDSTRAGGMVPGEIPGRAAGSDLPGASSGADAEGLSETDAARVVLGGEGFGSAAMVPEESSGSRWVAAHETPTDVSSPPSDEMPAERLLPVVSGPRTDNQVKKGNAWRLIYQGWKKLQSDKMSRKDAAVQLGVSDVTLWRIIKRVEATGEGGLAPDTANCGRRSRWAFLVDESTELGRTVCKKLMEIYVATLGASSESATIDRRTGNMSAALRTFTLEPECPAGLKPLLLSGRHPLCLRRYLARITPEVEALIRGEKHFKLNGHAGRRDKTIGLPDGRRAYLPAGWVVELDDMSVNQPFWVEGPGAVSIVSRQGLYARCLKGGWRAVDLVARVREAYTAADILRFVRKFCERHGKPRVLRIERGIWMSCAIRGFKLDLSEEEIIRPAMADGEKNSLKQGLEAIGIEVQFCSSARGKSDLEGGFNSLQTQIAIFTRDFVNIGRHAGEFESGAKQMRRVRAGSHHPGELGFPHQNELLQRILQAFDFINSLPRKNAEGVLESFDQVWERDTQRYPMGKLDAHDYAAFLPELRERTIDGGAVYPQADGKAFAFRAQEFGELGDGYRVYVRFDPAEPALGAGIYNREPRTATINQKGYAPGALICLARYDVPAPTTYATNVPEGLPTYTVSQLYGEGAAQDHGALLKKQRTSVRKFVRTAFGTVRPGQPAQKTVEARDGAGNVAKVEVGGVSRTKPVEAPLRSAKAVEADRVREHEARLKVEEQQRAARRRRWALEAEISNSIRSADIADGRR